MKKLFATLASTVILSLSIGTVALAQDNSTSQEPTTPAQEQVTEPNQSDNNEATTQMTEDVSGNENFHQALKRKFIEGGADFMAIIALLLIIGLSLCLERIIYLSLCNVNSDKMLEDIEDALSRNDIEGAKNIARNTRGPVASIAYQALLRLNQSTEEIERSIVSYGSVQGGLLEKNLSWITLFIAIAPSLGFLGTVVGMVMAFDNIQKVGDISPTVVAGGMKVALITTIGGLVVALILQLFYNFILSRVEALLNKMEDASVTLMDIVIKYNLKR